MNSFNIDQQILIFTETWLNKNFLNTEILCNKFNIYRRDRGNNTTGGGVLIAVSCNLSSELVVMESPHDDIEFISVSIKINGYQLFISCSYIPPSSHQSLYGKHAEAIRSVARSSKDGDSLFIFGHFNLPSTEWKFLPDDGYLIQTRQNSNFDDFFNILYDMGLFQINGIRNEYSKILDLIFVNDVSNSFIKRSSPISCPEDRYHPTIELRTSISLNFSTPSSSKNEKVFSFKHANYNKLNELLLDTNWQYLFSCHTNVDDKLKAFYMKLNNFLNLCVPMRKSENLSGPPWNNKQLAYAKNRKNKCYKKFRQSGSYIDYMRYSITRAEYNILNKSCYNNYLNTMKINFKRNPKSFFKFVNSKKKTTCFPLSMKFQQYESSDEAYISNLFANFFSITYSDATYNDSLDYPFKITANQLVSFTFN
ncbi:uncharacterized protein LOC119603306 [Lucilia sericata]|uniref:uncharacterized protein LOC119603306 n=1 Tax=Lucilia sericata TaxID=13632 RepID=UPI0018A82E1F|nr:uncharacterized protein LOC119603306 [Lucilia sericata]